MVSCLMGDSTALASAIVRCCLKEYFGKICYARGVSGDYEKQHLESINDIMKSLNL